MNIRAFSLIELMVVIAIVAVLAAAALPSYKQYRTRAQLSTVLPILENLKMKATMYYNQNGAWPSVVSHLGLSGTTVNTYFSPDALANAAPNNFITGVGICNDGCMGAAPANRGITGIFLYLSGSQLGLSGDRALIFVVQGADPNFNWICTTDSGSLTARELPPSCYP